MAAGRALVTGAHGFAAAWLCGALLDDGWEVAGFDRGRREGNSLELLGRAGDVEALSGDLRDTDAVESAVAGADAVFHLAAQTLVGEANASPRETFETNVTGTWNVLEAVRAADTGALVFASSDKAYGPSDDLPYTEQTALRATFPYDASKAAADIIARSYFHTYGQQVAVTRFANIYGGADLNFSRLIPESVTAALDNRPPVIRSDGSPERDYLYVEDAAAAYLAIAGGLLDGRLGGEAFNAGSGEPHSVRDVVSLVCEIAAPGLAPDIQGEGTPAGEIDRQWLDATKLIEMTPWNAEVQLREGIERTVEWYREHPEVRARA